MKKAVMWLFVGLSACVTKEEKGVALIEDQLKSSSTYVDFYRSIVLDTLDFYPEVKEYVLRLTYSVKKDENETFSVCFVVMRDDLLIKGMSNDLRAIDSIVTLSTFHKYAKEIDFGAHHLLGDFDLVPSEELIKIDLSSRGIIE